MPLPGGVEMPVRPFKYQWIGYPIIIGLIIVVIGCWWWDWGRCGCGSVTTVYVVRHAEKASSPSGDPPLTAAGQARAQDLFELVKDSGIEAVFASNFLRTQQTVQPTASGLGLSITVTSASDVGGLVSQILADHGGKSILVSGHSNTVPEIVEELGGAAIDPIAESEFDNLFVVYRRQGCPSRVSHLHYGEPD